MVTARSRAVVNRAIEILASQNSVPDSPAARDQTGKVNLCLAAAVAKAGLLVMNRHDEATLLEEELVRTRSKERMKLAYLELGWTAEECQQKLELNDRTNPSTRKDVVIDFLRNSSPS